MNTFFRRVFKFLTPKSKALKADSVELETIASTVSMKTCNNKDHCHDTVDKSVSMENRCAQIVCKKTNSAVSEKSDT